ncbi:hypothetical protein P9265_15445 [Schinkia azotoformans]|nr:hypothetical protein [Schinkia azotoformans]
MADQNKKNPKLSEKDRKNLYLDILESDKNSAFMLKSFTLENRKKK